MVKIIKIEDTRTEKEIEEQYIFEFNCVKQILMIIIESSRLSIIGDLINTNNEVIYRRTIYELYESILNNILILEKTNCELYNDFSEHEEFNYIIYNLGNLDYERSAEIGITILNYFSNLILYDVLKR